MANGFTIAAWERETASRYNGRAARSIIKQMRTRLILAILLLAIDLRGEGLLIRESKTKDYMEIAAPVKKNAGKEGKIEYMIYSYPTQGNPTEEEIAMHFAKDLPFAISGVYLVATIIPEQSYKSASEQCDLYLTLPNPQLNLTDARQIEFDSSYGKLRFFDNDRFDHDELVKWLLEDLLNRMFIKYRGKSNYNVGFVIRAVLDEGGNVVLENDQQLDKAMLDKSKISGLLIEANVHNPEVKWQPLRYVKVTGDILTYLRMRKYFVSVNKDYSNKNEYLIYKNSIYRSDRGNSVLAMVYDKKLSCFNLPFINGTAKFSDEINLKEWRVVKGCDAFDVQAEVVRIRKLNRLEEMLHGRQTWEIVLFLLYWAGIFLFYYWQFVFVKNCSWSPLAWVFSLGMSVMAVGFFYYLYYRRTFPYAPELPLATALTIYAFSVLGALLYSVLRKKKPAAIAVLLVMLETFAFLVVLYALGHAGG